MVGGASNGISGADVKELTVWGSIVRVFSCIPTGLFNGMICRFHGSNNSQQAEKAGYSVKEELQT